MSMIENKNIKQKYKSPLHKLVRFFEESRDRWKKKYMNLKKKTKLLSNQIHYLKNRIVELKQENKALKSEIEEVLKKKHYEKPDIIKKFDVAPKFHTYSYSHIFMFIQMVICGSMRMRAVERAMEMFFSFLEINVPVPSWYVGRLWIMRIGLYKLERPKQIANDWIWIIDHTVQLGKEKCLIILGIRQQDLPKGNLCLTHEDLEPIALLPVERSNGDIVFQQLEETLKKTGVPKQIVSDHGTDLKSGIEKICQKYDTIVHTYDTKHKGAAILKRELKNNPDWQQFAKKASQTGKKVQQTDLAALAPPNQRSKARYMNVDVLVNWGNEKIAWLDHNKSQDSENFKNSDIYQKLGWLYEFQDNLKEWKTLSDIISTTGQYINRMGLKKGVHEGLKLELSKLPQSNFFTDIPAEMVQFIKNQEDKICDGGRLLGSSEAIESVIGKYKRLQHDQVKGGFTGMLLGLAASISDLTMDTVQKAIATVSIKNIHDWLRDNIKKSVFPQRKEIRKILNKKEQKRDEKIAGLCT